MERFLFLVFLFVWAEFATAQEGVTPVSGGQTAAPTGESQAITPASESQGFMTAEEKEVWISSGIAVLPQITQVFEGTDWDKYESQEEDEPRAKDMADILGEIIKKDENALRRVEETLKVAGSGIRRGILFTLQKTWTLKPEIISGLSASARDSNRIVRFHTAILLSEINSDKIVPAILPLLDSETDEIIRCKLAEGLVKQKSNKGTEVLLKNLSHTDMWVREAAANGLGLAKTKAVYSALEKAIKTEESNIVQSAIISSMNDISGVSQQRLWDKYITKRKKPAPPAPKETPQKK